MSGGEPRSDLLALVDAWDKKTMKKGRDYSGNLTSLENIIGSETALAVEPCATWIREENRHGTWGMLCLTQTRLLLEARTGSLRFNLQDIENLNIYGGRGMLSSGGPVIEVRTEGEPIHLELLTDQAAQRMWPALQEQWNLVMEDARSRPKTQASSSPSSVADELSKLAELRAQGILTEEEFAAQKDRILSTS